MNALDVLCAQFTRDFFTIAKFLLTIGRLLLHCWYSLGRHMTTDTPMVIFAVLTLFWLSFDCFWLYLAIGTVYHSSKTAKNSQKTDKLQKSSLVYQSSHVYTESAEYTKPRKRRYLAKPPSHVPGQWPHLSPVGRADCICLHGRPCVWLPFAAACCYTLFYLLMMPGACLVCQRPSSNFPYFRTPLANFLLSRANSVEYGNSKTTTLLHSANCTRPLFRGRTGCGGRPSGRRDIVTCQSLV